MNARLKGSGELLLENLFILATCCWPGALGIMLAAGVVHAHAHVLPAVAPIGYWPSFGLYWCLVLIRAGSTGADQWEHAK